MHLRNIHLLFRLAIIPIVAFWPGALWAQPNLLIDLRFVQSSERAVENGTIVEKRYKTSLGIVSITPSEDGVRLTGATAQLRNHVIARARVLRANQNEVEIEESQFSVQNPVKPAYVGRVTFNGFRDRIVASTVISGVKLYVVFVDWQWAAR